MTSTIERTHTGGRASASIAAKLDALASPTTHVFHNIAVGPVDCAIDHLIVAPSGVYAVDTWHYPGRHVTVEDYAMHVGDAYSPALRNAKFQAERTASLLEHETGLDVPVRGCVVLLTGARTPHVTYASRPIGVSLLTKRDVPRWFLGQSPVLTQGEVTAIVWAARRSLT